MVLEFMVWETQGLSDPTMPIGPSTRPHKSKPHLETQMDTRTKIHEPNMSLVYWANFSPLKNEPIFINETSNYIPEPISDPLKWTNTH